MRSTAPLVAFVCALALIACRGDPPQPAEPARSAPPSAASSAPAPPPAAASADPCAGPGRACAPAPPEPGPYTPPPEEAKEAPEKGPKRQLGTLKDWIAAYEGSGAPEQKQPPRLGVLRDLPELPRSTLFYVRTRQIVRVDLPEGKETELTSGPSGSFAPRFTDDGGWLFFLSNRDGAVDKVFRMRPDGARVEAITKPLRTQDVGFSWAVSGDGARVAYVRDVGDSQREVHLVDVASKADEVIHRGLMLGDLAFSRDGRTLFFVQGWLSVPGPGLEDPRLLAALDLASHTVKTLPNAGFAEIKAPQDLGDGRLLFAASQDFSMAGRSPRLYSMPIGGGAWSDLGHTSAPAGFVHAHPSPDRKKMATSWSVREGGFGADWREEVSVESLSSASTRALTSAFPRPFYGAHSPSWAPDGRHLAFVLALCPYAGCDISLFSVVLADTDATDSKLAFVAYGRSPVFFPGRPQ